MSSPFLYLSLLAVFVALYAAFWPFNEHKSRVQTDVNTGPDTRTNTNIHAIKHSSSVVQVCFIGNSYTSLNNLPAMVSAYAQNKVGFRPVHQVSHLMSGATLSDHAQNENVRSLLSSDSNFEIVVLQDQSQVPGLPFLRHRSIESIRNEFVPMIVEIQNQRIRRKREKENIEGEEIKEIRNGSLKVVLFETWGRRHSDDRFTEEFSDFQTMNDKLAEGYALYKEVFLELGVEAEIAHVGKAFAIVHKENPPMFAQLYTSDGSHPSIHGSYLATCIINGVIQQEVKENVDFMSNEIELNEREFLQSVCSRVLLNNGP